MRRVFVTFHRDREFRRSSTRDYDRTAKLITYQKMLHVSEILLIEPSFAKIEYFYRDSEKAFARAEFHMLEDDFPLRHLGITLSLKEIYQGIEFSAN